MNDLVETVARAIWKQFESEEYPWERLSPAGQRAFKRDAQAAITATLEATEKQGSIHTCPECHHTFREQIKEQFKPLDFKEETKGSV